RSAVRWKTEHASPTVAARCYNGLLNKIGTLHRHPTRCPLAAENDKFPEEIRDYCTAGRNSTSIESYSPSGMTPSISSMCVTVHTTSWNPDAALPPRRP
ncbi:MAG TPA: hypothetical protein VKA15_08040, partial [Isosphaeraceae bacterium]|nr:hypothetical protein [Isosphaeraceae bacterium]